MPNYTIHKSDCIEWMDAQPERSIDCIITSPPYNLDIKYGSYQDDLPRDSYLKWLSDVARATKRVLKDQGHQGEIGKGGSALHEWKTQSIFHPLIIPL